MRSTMPQESSEGKSNVTVFDPVNKKGYELRFGGDDAEVFSTIGLQIYFDQKRHGGCKRVFLCKKYQAKLCRAEAMCNSIHACRRKVSEMRKLYPSSENEAGVKVFSEADDERFDVPVSRVHQTAGSFEALARLQMAATSANPSSTMPYYLLCTAFENRACFKGDQCEKVHVDPRYLHSMRALWGVPCCGDPTCPSGSSIAADLPGVATEEGVMPWTHFSIQRAPAAEKGRLANTKGLKDLLATLRHGALYKDVVQIPSAKLCRPHLRRQCKWGPDCNNVHLCRMRLPEGVTAMPVSQGVNVSPPPTPATTEHLNVPGVKFPLNLQRQPTLSVTASSEDLATAAQRSPKTADSSYTSACSSSSVASLSASDEDEAPPLTIVSAVAALKLGCLPLDVNTEVNVASQGTNLSDVLSSFRAINLPCGGVHVFP